MLRDNFITMFEKNGNLDDSETGILNYNNFFKTVKGIKRLFAKNIKLISN